MYQKARLILVLEEFPFIGPWIHGKFLEYLDGEYSELNGDIDEDDDAIVFDGKRRLTRRATIVVDEQQPEQAGEPICKTRLVMVIHCYRCTRCSRQE